MFENSKPPFRAVPLQEFLAIQSNHPKNIGFFGTRNMGFMHQQLIEVLSYAMVLTVRVTAGRASLLRPPVLSAEQNDI